MVSKDLLEILVCPLCKGPLEMLRDARRVVAVVEEDGAEADRVGVGAEEEGVVAGDALGFVDGDGVAVANVSGVEVPGGQGPRRSAGSSCEPTE